MGFSLFLRFGFGGVRKGGLERGVGEGLGRGLAKGWGKVGLGRAWLFILQKPGLHKTINVH